MKSRLEGTIFEVCKSKMCRRYFYKLTVSWRLRYRLRRVSRVSNLEIYIQTKIQTDRNLFSLFWLHSFVEILVLVVK